ncbi:MAG: Gfo/Idh/MocA family oxidoreductase [Phycisphaeraceae bacterium]
MIGCGSHAFRNIYPALQFLPIELKAVCDLKAEKAEAYAQQFGAGAAYADMDAMLASEPLEAVLVVTNYDKDGRPRFPDITCRCLEAGQHVWIEKPPAATCSDIERMQRASQQAGRHVVVGFNKIFSPANVKARELINAAEFGDVSLAMLQYPQGVPEAGAIRDYLNGAKGSGGLVGFLDHLCHPMSLLVDLLGMPETLFYQRGNSVAAAATLTFAGGAVATLALTARGPGTPAYERTQLLSTSTGQMVTVENNLRVTLHRSPGLQYGSTPSYYAGDPDRPSLVWEPEMSMGQLYNKGLFLLGTWGELNEFTQCILCGRPPEHGTLEQARQVTRLFEAFAEGPGKLITLT